MVRRAAVVLGGGVVALAVGWRAGAAMRPPSLELPPVTAAPVARDCDAALRGVRRQIAEAPVAVSTPQERLTVAECLQRGRDVRKQEIDAWAADVGLDREAAALRWAAPPPPELTDAGFTALLEQAIADCGVFAEVAAVDCSEPPCVAALTTLDTSLSALDVARCGGPLFGEGDGATIGTSTSAPLACAGGGEGKALLVGASLERTAAVGGVVAPYDRDAAAGRAWQRVNALKAGLACPSGISP